MAQSQPKTVLFLCTGNYYRSRFAEVVFNSVANKMGLAWRASSRGLALEQGAANVGPMAASAVKALEAMGIRAGDALTRLPASVTIEDFEQADRIVALKQTEHHPLLQDQFPAYLSKIEFWHIDDAPGVLHLIEHGVMGLVARILGGVERRKSELVDAPISDPPPVKAPPKRKSH